MSYFGGDSGRSLYFGVDLIRASFSSSLTLVLEIVGDLEGLVRLDDEAVVDTGKYASTGSWSVLPALVAG